MLNPKQPNNEEIVPDKITTPEPSPIVEVKSEELTQKQVEKNEEAVEEKVDSGVTTPEVEDPSGIFHSF